MEALGMADLNHAVMRLGSDGIINDHLIAHL